MTKETTTRMFKETFWFFLGTIYAALLMGLFSILLYFCFLWPIILVPFVVCFISGILSMEKNRRYEQYKRNCIRSQINIR